MITRLPMFSLPAIWRQGRLLAMAACALLLGACGSIDIEHYRQQQPRLLLEQYFNGQVEAWGLFQKRNGEVVKRFHVTLNCRWQGDTGTLDEYFRFSDGTTQRRVWTVRKVAADRYVGTADDVVGEAHGQQAGNALRWAYTLRLPVDGRDIEVQFDDWMFLVDEQTLLNRARMSKFGIELGQVTLSFRKVTQP